MDEIFNCNVARIKVNNPQLADVLCRNMLSGNSISIETVNKRDTTVIVNGILLTSSFDREGEAEIVCRRIPEDAEIAHVYGAALLDHVEYLLLHRPKLRKLHLHILNLELLIRLLRMFDVICLGDPRVEVSTSNKLTRVEFPFTTYISELILTDKFCQKIRDHLYYQLNKPHKHDFLIRDGARALKNIEDNRKLMLTDQSVDALFGSLAGRSVAVVSRGWSLDDDIETLRELILRKDLFVICADLSSKTLFNNNIPFDLVAGGCPNFTSDMVSQSPDGNAGIVYVPTMALEIVEMFDKRYVAFTSVPILDSVKQEKAASSLYYEGSATHFACDLAVKMGASSVYMFGCDYSIVQGRVHTFLNDVDSTRVLLPADSQFVTVAGTSGEDVQSLSVFRDYLCALEEYIQDHPDVQFYNMSWIGAEIKGTLRYA